MQEIYDMTWAEFNIRSFGFKRVRKWQMFLTREIAYEVHCSRYSWTKKNPPKKDNWWPLEKKTINNETLELLKELRKQKNGTT